MVNSKIWGKTVIVAGKNDYYPLMAHLLDSATVAGILWDEWLRPSLRERLDNDFGGRGKSALQLAAGIHDIGKCSPIFQGALLAKNPQKPRHDVIEMLSKDGFDFPEIELAQRKKFFHRHEKLGFYSLNPELELDEESANHWLELAILGHHGDFGISYGTLRDSEQRELEMIISPAWIQEQKAMLSEIENSVSMTIAEAQGITVSSVTVLMISGLLILADRIASNEDSVNRAHLELRRGDLNLQESASWLSLRRGFLRDLVNRELGLEFSLDSTQILGNYSARGVQKIVPEGEGLWLCMAPTGTGKTEAVLMRHSQEEERLIFLLPTMATTNAMMNRVLKLYSSSSKKTAVLGHGQAFLEDFYSLQSTDALEEDQEDCGLTPTKFSGVKGAKLSAAVNIATIDQLLSGGIAQKWTHLRWILLLNSHIIIDEAHLLDRYQFQLLKPLLKLAGILNTRVSILSATLPEWLQKEITGAYGESISADKFPASILTSLKESSPEVEAESYEVDITLIPTDNIVEAHILWLESTLNSHPRARAGIFVNQVQRAQEIALALKDKFPDVTVLCLHSRLLSGHRREVTESLLKAVGTTTGTAERFVIVGTQTIEMSLDIDLDFISTDLCPAPSLIQRMGRSWRKRDADRSSRTGHSNQSVTIIYPIKDGALEPKGLLPYGEAVLERTLHYLKSIGKLSFPEELQSFVETTYLEKEDNYSEAELDEKSTEFFQELRGKRIAIELDSLLVPYYPPEVRDFGALTRSDFTEENSTRLVEGIYTEPIVLKSDDYLMIARGAVPLATDLKKISAREALAATAFISNNQAKELEESGLERIPVGKYFYGYFSEVPTSLRYDSLVGLVNDD
jgi:CRISPR-associated endonuclease/helicase Cas3